MFVLGGQSALPRALGALSSRASSMSDPPDTLWDATGRLDRRVAEVDLVLQARLLMSPREASWFPALTDDLTELAQSCSACDLALAQQAEVKCLAVEREGQGFVSALTFLGRAGNA